MTYHPLGNDNISTAVETAVNRLKLKVDGSFVFGWHKKSAGCRVITSDGEILWLRVQSRPKGTEPSKLWLGLQEAEPIPIENKPKLKSLVEWVIDARVWRAELMTFVPYSVCSSTAELRAPLMLGSNWYTKLVTALSSLSLYKTERVNARQDLITRRLHERFGSAVDSRIDEWATAHGDIHWANLTRPDCWIFDWEAWGRSPQGLDAATLYCFSLMQAETARDVYTHFKYVLDSPDGIKSQLFMCAELMRMSELHGDHPDLYPHLKKLASRLLLKSD
jgi:hypothetical protein